MIADELIAGCCTPQIPRRRFHAADCRLLTEARFFQAG